MFANAHQSGFLSIFYSVGSNPLAIWDKQVKNGHIRRVLDDDVKSLVLEVSGTNVATTYITCPIKPRASLGVKLPFLVMVIKNMKKYFTFEIQILDDKDMHRRFRVSNFQSTTKVRPFCTTMPIGLSAGWNQVQFNLADFTKRAYGSTYLETMRVQIHANVRIRRIYFADMLYSDDEMPNEYKLFMPNQRKSVSRKSDPDVGQLQVTKKDEKQDDVPSGALPTPVGGSGVIEDIAAEVQKPLGEEPQGAKPPEEGAQVPPEGADDTVPPEGVDDTIPPEVDEPHSEGAAAEIIKSEEIEGVEEALVEGQGEEIIEAPTDVEEAPITEEVQPTDDAPAEAPDETVTEDLTETPAPQEAEEVPPPEEAPPVDEEATPAEVAE